MSDAHGAAAARRVAEGLREWLGIGTPAAAIILGSGLGGLVARLERTVRVPFADIPGFPAATVAGHSGALVAGKLGGKEVIALAGRFHMYEGHDAALAAFPVRVMRAMGASVLIVSNAAGGIRHAFRPGDLMLIADHLNLMGRNPLLGAVQPGDERFPDMSSPYDPALRVLVQRAALATGVALTSGVYAGLLGPSYETPAEVRMLRTLGADAVGMSTVPEVIAARAMGMRVAGISCITNLACGISPTLLSHAEVLETSQRVGARFERLIAAVVTEL